LAIFLKNDFSDLAEDRVRLIERKEPLPKCPLSSKSPELRLFSLRRGRIELLRPLQLMMLQTREARINKILS